MFPYRISCTIVHVPHRSPIPSHVYYSLASRDNTSVVHRGSDRSILFADLPVSRIRVAQSVSSSFGFPDNTRNTPVHFSASLSRTEGETRRGKFLYRNRNAWIVREWTTRRGSRIRSYLDKNMYSKAERKTMVADFRSNNGNNVDATRSYAG